jgi:N-acetylglucosamine kinase-like BadF-type ATPase
LGWEFGIDVAGEDNKTTIHHKVATRVVCVIFEQDVLVALHAEWYQQHQQ